jgi:hypothetical protein
MSSASPVGAGTEPGAGSGTGRERALLPRWAWWLLAPGLLMPVAILVVIGIAELMHAESRCPFAQRSLQTLAPGVSVREEARQCIPGKEERRYRLERAGTMQVLGQRRLAREDFGPDRYLWTASFNDRGEVQVIVNSKPHGEVMFREGTAQEHAGGKLEPPPRK